MKTYKYLGKVSSECFLSDLTFRFSQPAAFNDPFELQPEFHVIDESLSETDEVPCKFVLEGHPQSYEKYLLKSHLKETQIKKIDNKNLLSQLNEKIGILCLTKSSTLLPTNFLMWAHYAESHQGVVVEFKNDSEFVKDARSVHYLPRRPIIDAKLLYDNEYVSISDLYFKSDEWNYENEHRITKNLESCTQLDSTDALGISLFVSSVPIEAIECIYLGCNASNDLKSAAYKLHQDTGVKVMYLKIHDEEYKLVPYANFGGSYSDVFNLSKDLLFNRDKK